METYAKATETQDAGATWKKHRQFRCFHAARIRTWTNGVRVRYRMFVFNDLASSCVDFALSTCAPRMLFHASGAPRTQHAALDWLIEQHDAARIGLAVGRVIDTYQVRTHFTLEIADCRFAFRRREDEIAAEARLDGIYVVRTSLPADKLASEQAVAAYKSLAVVERAFRTMKGVDMQVRPVHHWLSTRVRAHVFLCMLAYYVEHHMRLALAPL